MINLEHLQQFSVVSRCLNFTKAAECLYISHSTISRNMSALEMSLGVKLFIRNNRSVTLTRAGEILSERTQQIFDSIGMMEYDVKRAANADSGKLSVASINLYISEIFRTYSYINQNWPEIDISVFLRTENEIFSMLSTGEADIGILFSFSNSVNLVSDKYEFHPLQEGRFQVLVSENHPLAQIGHLNPMDPRLTEVVTLAQMDNEFVNTLGKRITPDGTLHTTVPSLESLFMQVKAGMGAALLPQHAASEAGSGCARLEIDDVDSTYQILLCRLKSNRNPSIELLQEAYQIVTSSK